MNIYEILAELRGLGMIPEQMTECRRLEGGTNSKVWAVTDGGEPALVIKANTPDSVRSEVRFLSFYYDLPYLSKLMYTDPDGRYYVYSYLQGKIDYKPGRKTELLERLAERFFGRYKPVPDMIGYGVIGESPYETWQSFLESELQGARQAVGEHVSEADYREVIALARNEARTSARQAYMLHGDCGVHNFLFRQGELSGIIDPIPMAGMPIYDLVFAFCSSPDELEPETIAHAAERLPGWEGTFRDLREEVLIGLYSRMSACIYHHPQDLPIYLQAWERWKSL